MKKRWYILLILISCIYLTSASLIIETAPKEKYILGQKINIKIRAVLEKYEQAFLNSAIHCSEKSLNYFKLPLDKDSDELIQIPKLKTDESFLGSCILNITLTDLNENIIENITTESFEITNFFNLTISIPKQEYAPGETVTITGSVEDIEKYNLYASLKGDDLIDSITKNLTTKTFDISFIIPETEKGTKKIEIEIEDEFKNTASETKEITILQIPKSLELSMPLQELDPRESLTLISNIYDQAGEIMYEEVIYEIKNSEEIIDTLTHTSGSEVIILFPEHTPPGEYTAIASYENLQQSKTFSITEFREITLKVENKRVVAVNIGNIRYTEEMEINASADGIVYQIPLTLDLKPGETTIINISGELPSKNYSLALSSDRKTYTLNQTFIEGRRSLLKKMSQKIASITGSAVIETQDVSNVFYLGFILVLAGFIILIIVFGTFRKKIIKVVDDTVKTQSKKITGLRSSVDKHKKEKSKLQKMFGRYVDHDLLKNNPKKITKRQISVLFTDIRGYSKIFDKKDSSEIADMLNMYFSKSSRIIKNNKGFINKFIGDSVMALFNSIKDDPNHLINSIKSAIEIKEQMSLLNQALIKKGLDPIEIGIGIDSGLSTVGNLGSKNKLEFTAIGVPVNLAFRLQSISNGKILITENVYNKLKSRISATFFKETEMKNITGKVRIYEVNNIIDNSQ